MSLVNSAPPALLLREDARRELACLLASRAALVGHNTAYDLVVAMAEWSELARPIFDAVDEGRARCTFIRQCLLDVAAGEAEFRRRVLGGEVQITKASRALDALVALYFGEVLEKDDEIRLRYGELDGLPVEEWPERFRTYVLRDAEEPVRIFEAQERRAAELAARPDMEGVWETEPGESIPDERPQTRAALWLQLMSAWGLRTDPAAVRALADKHEADQAERKRRLMPTGMIRPDGSRDMKAIQAHVLAAYVALGQNVPCTNPSSKFPEGQIKCDTETLCDSGDEELVLLGESLSDASTIGTWLPWLELGTTTPICVGYNPVLETGRASARKPNIMNPPRAGSIRSCFVARPGTVFVFADYATAELRALAQVCIWLLGWSDLGDALRAGEDPHLSLAADVEGITYAEALARSKAGDKQIKDTRQLAKCFHPDTEILTRRRGWVRIADLSMNDEVASASPRDQRKVSPERGRDAKGQFPKGERVDYTAAAAPAIDISWVRPERLTWRHADKLLHFKNEAIDLRVTPDHRMLTYGGTKAHKVVEAQEFGKQRGWFNAGMCASGSITVDERLLRLAVATQADGSYIVKGVTQRRIKLGFSKTRKIDRLRSLLHEGEYRISVHSNGKNKPTTSFTLSRELSAEIQGLLDPDKTLPWWWIELRPELRSLALDEAAYWDSHQSSKMRCYHYSSTIKKNTEVLQALAVITNRKACYRDGAGKTNILSVRDKHDTRGENVKVTEIQHDGGVVCLTVPSSFVLVRDGGVPMITGQCANFGYPGGLGAEKFVLYAHAYDPRFKNIIDLRLSNSLRSAWFKKWREMRKYFDCVSAAVGRDGEGAIQQFGSRRVRGRCGFTQAANGTFQGLVADGAKRAGWALARECYLGDWMYPPEGDEEQALKAAGKPSPLLGSRPVLFMHDEFGLEVPYRDPRAASVAADRQARVQRLAMQSMIPDVPIECGAAMMKRWQKGAEPLREDGLLVPCRPDERDGKTIWVRD